MTGDPGAAGMRWLWDHVAGSAPAAARRRCHQMSRRAPWVLPELSPAPHRAAIVINVTTISIYAHGCGNDHYPGQRAPGTRTE